MITRLVRRAPAEPPTGPPHPHGIDAGRGAWIAFAIAAPGLAIGVLAVISGARDVLPLTLLVVLAAVLAGGAVTGALIEALHARGGGRYWLEALAFTVAFAGGAAAGMLVLRLSHGYLAARSGWPPQLDAVASGADLWWVWPFLLIAAMVVAKSFASDLPLSFSRTDVSSDAVARYVAIGAFILYAIIRVVDGGPVQTAPADYEIAADLASARRLVDAAQERARSRRRDARAQFAYGAALYYVADADSALAVMRRAIELDDKAVEPYVWAADLEERTGRFDEALADADRAIALAPNYGWAYRMRGRALAALSRESEALAAHERSVSLDPLDPGAHLELGGTRMRTNDMVGALRSVRTAQRLDSSLLQPLMAEAQLQKALGRFPEARSALERALAGRSDDPRVLSAYAELLYESGDAAGAAAAFARVDAAAPAWMAERIDHRMMWAHARRGLTGEVPGLQDSLRALAARRPRGQP